MKGRATYVVVENVSKNGKPYKSLELHFKNGYVMTVFLNNEQAYILSTIKSEDEE